MAQLIEEGKLMKLDFALIPNIKNLDPKFLKASYDPTGEYHVIKDFGITMFFYNNTIVTDQPEDDEGLLRPAERIRQQGPDEPPRRRRGGRPPRR